MEFIDGKTIKLDKDPNELDKLVITFIDILKKYANYVVVSGYVAILFGRSRGTEDIDILIEEIPKEQFFKFLEDIIKHRFWCINTDEREEMYDMLQTGDAIRFAIKHTFQPNFEVKFIKDKIQERAIKEKIKVILPKYEMYTSPLEMQIAYKEVMLKSEKDKEDALHLRKLFKEKLNESRIEMYKNLINEELKEK